MEDKSKIEEPKPVEVPAKATAVEESVSQDELPSDIPLEIALSNETTTDDDPDGITATEVIEQIFASPQEDGAIYYDLNYDDLDADANATVP